MTKNPPASHVPSVAFTTTANGKLRALINEVKICQAVTPSTPAVPAHRGFNAIWDTGATNTVVTDNVIRDCGLAPTGMTQTHGVHGVQVSKTYIIDIVLINSAEVRGVQVTAGQLPAGTDVLIGMDIIGMGDFAVTNFEGKTTFSFRVPSLKRICYVTEQNLAHEALKSTRIRTKTIKRPKKQFGKSK